MMLGRQLRRLAILIVYNAWATECAGTFTGIRPHCGSYNGGQLITITGNDLKSSRFDLGRVFNKEHVDTTDGEGFDYEIWFEAGGSKVACDVNALDATHGVTIGEDFVICRTRQFPIFHQKWIIHVKIDGVEVPFSGANMADYSFGKANEFWLSEAYRGTSDSNICAPFIEKVEPQPSAPAKPLNSFDFEGAYWTEWYDLQTHGVTNGQRNEFETLHDHKRFDPETFSRCRSPIDIYVEDKTSGLELVSSDTNEENANGIVKVGFNNPAEGVRCTQWDQQRDPETGKFAMVCPDVRVKYQCLPNIIEVQHTEGTEWQVMNDPFLSRTTDEFKGTCQTIINYDGEKQCQDGQNCGYLKKFSQDKRLMRKFDWQKRFQCQPVVPIPGSYNLKFNTHARGSTVTNNHLEHRMARPDLSLSNFEVFPEIRAVSPQVGEASGGTMLTITGTGFVSDGLGGDVSVSVGDQECDIVSLEETRITCTTRGGDVEKNENEWWRSRPFTIYHNNSLIIDGDYIITLRTVASSEFTLAECQNQCKIDSSCVAFSWNPK